MLLASAPITSTAPSFASLTLPGTVLPEMLPPLKPTYRRSNSAGIVDVDAATSTINSTSITTATTTAMAGAPTKNNRPSSGAERVVQMLGIRNLIQVAGVDRVVPVENSDEVGRIDHRSTATVNRVNSSTAMKAMEATHVNRKQSLFERFKSCITSNATAHETDLEDAPASRRSVRQQPRRQSWGVSRQPGRLATMAKKQQVTVASSKPTGNALVKRSSGGSLQLRRKISVSTLAPKHLQLVDNNGSVGSAVANEIRPVPCQQPHFPLELPPLRTDAVALMARLEATKDEALW